MFDAEFTKWLETLAGPGGSDLYVTVGVPPVLRGDDGFGNLTDTKLDKAAIDRIIATILNEKQLAEFNETGEFNMAIALDGVGRFRLNLFKQMQMPGIVARIIRTEIPTAEKLGLPKVITDLALEKRGLVFVVGGTGSGKSTTLAAMIDNRNAAGPGHIITVEDPVEFVHPHKQCIVTHREVGVDTDSFDVALKNTLRQHPDLILIGEIRDAHTMEHALNIAETGHLALATLHANNANQAIERVVNFFPQESHHQVLLNMALNVRGIISQRLVHKVGGGRCAAIEIMLNQGLVKQLIQKGEVKQLKSVMEENAHVGMQTFDMCLLKLFTDGLIDEETAVAESDNPGDMKMKLKQAKLSGAGPGGGGLDKVDTSGLSL